MNFLKKISVLLVVCLAAALAREPEFCEFWAVQESLREIEPWFRRRWLSERGLQDYYKQMSWKPDSQGIRCIGRWSYGPSVKVSPCRSRRMIPLSALPEALVPV